MKSKDWFLRVMVTLLVVGVWVLILKPVLAPAPSEAAAAEKVIRAQRFELVDEEGKPRAILHTNPGGADLALYDKSGVSRVELRCGEVLSGVTVFDRDGDHRLDVGVVEDTALVHLTGGGCAAELALEPSGRPRLQLLDNAGRSRAVLTLNEATNAPSLALRDKQGHPRAFVGLSDDDAPRVALSDKKRTRALLEANRSGSRLHLENHTGGGRATTEVDSNGKPSLTLSENSIRRAVLGSTRLTGFEPVAVSSLVLFDYQGKVRLSLGATDLETTRTGTVEKRPESSLVLFDKDAKVIWKAPP